MTSKNPTRIVVLGGGFAGAYCVQRLERRLRGTNAKVTLVNQHNNFVFTPMLVEAATSGIEPRHVVVPLRGFIKSGEFVMAKVESIDFDQQNVTVTPEFDGQIVIPYDYLVLALGSITKLPDIPGLKKFAFGLKTLADATVLRDRAIGMLEMANLCKDHEQRQSWLTFAVVGGGYTGVEAAGEFNSFLREATREYQHVQESDIRVMLIQRADRILEMLDEDLSTKASKVLTKNGIDIRLNDGITEVKETSFTLKSGAEIPSHTVIWSAGVAPSPILKELNLSLNSHGYIECERDLRIKDHDNLWGIGDCASNPDAEGNPYPPTAQHAIREGEQAAENLVAVIKDQPTKPLDYKTKGSMAPLGGRQAIANVFNVHMTGFPAWFLWRTVYLGLMPGFSRKARVALDWTTDLFFRRDFSQQNFHQDNDNSESNP